MTDSNLIIYLRKLIEDNGVTQEFTTAELYEYLNKHRVNLYKLKCSRENDSYLTFYAGYRNLDDVVLKDSEGTTIDEDDYTIETISGLITFNMARSDDVYIYGNSYDLFRTASEIWLIRASRTTFSGDVNLSGEVLPKSKYNYEYCMRKSQELRPSDLNLQIRRR